MWSSFKHFTQFTHFAHTVGWGWKTLSFWMNLWFEFGWEVGGVVHSGCSNLSVQLLSSLCRLTLWITDSWMTIHVHSNRSVSKKEEFLRIRCPVDCVQGTECTKTQKKWRNRVTTWFLENLVCNDLSNILTGSRLPKKATQNAKISCLKISATHRSLHCEAVCCCLQQEKADSIEKFLKQAGESKRDGQECRISRSQTKSNSESCELCPILDFESSCCCTARIAYVVAKSSLRATVFVFTTFLYFIWPPCTSANALLQSCTFLWHFRCDRIHLNHACSFSCFYSF